MAYCRFEIKGKAPFSQIFTNSRFSTVGLLQMANVEAQRRYSVRCSLLLCPCFDSYPFLNHWRFVGSHLIYQAVWFVRDKKHLSMLGPHEPPRHGVVQERKEGGEITIHVDQAARLRVEAKLRPREDFCDFFNCPKSARQSNKGIREVEHHHLSLVHGADNTKFRKPLMRHFVCEGFRDDTANYTSGFQDGVGTFAHKPDISATVNKFIVPISQCLAKLPGHCHGARVKAWT
jgi:hypothetical protein